ncbi:MAG: FHA domain-containing protein [Deltaproteobacteria bacterium]|nr:FHA domain-containing protein [Deltaproteobacteria bacterium]
MPSSTSEYTDRNITVPSEGPSSPDVTVAPTLNEKLLQEGDGLKKERDLLRGRMQKAEANKEKVSETVYKKIKGEYQQKFDETTARFVELKGQVDRELADLSKKQSTLERQMALRQQILEEAKFRHMIGEYEESQFKELESKESAEIGRLEKALEQFSGAIQRYQKLFEGEDLPQTAPRKTDKKPAAAQSLKAKVAEIIREEAQDDSEEVKPEASDYSYLTEEDPFEEELQDLTAKDSEVSIPPPPKQIQVPSAKKQVIPVLVQMENGKMLQEFNLTEPVTIGRSPSNTVVLSESRISRKHAIVEKRGNSYVVIDLDSSNGTLVNGKKVKEYTLKPGDEFKIGNAQFLFRT